MEVRDISIIQNKKKRFIFFSMVCLVFSFCTSITLLAQVNQVDVLGRKQGLWKQKGWKKSWIECFYVNDTLHGAYKIYNKRGKLVGEENYLKGVLEGLSRSYWREQCIRQEITYVNGQPNGIMYLYNDRCELIKSVSVKNGVWDGAWMGYTHGRKMVEAYFKAGILDGPFTEYHYETGKVYLTVHFEDGKILSGQRTYDKNGRLETLKLPGKNRDLLIYLVQYNPDGTKKTNKTIKERPASYSHFGPDVHRSGPFPPFTESNTEK